MATIPARHVSLDVIPREFTHNDLAAISTTFYFIPVCVAIENAATFHKLKLVSENLGYLGLDSGQSKKCQAPLCLFRQAACDNRYSTVLSFLSVTLSNGIALKEQVTPFYVQVGKKGLLSGAINDMPNGLCKRGERQKIHFLWRSQLSDPKDDHILELAVAAGCADTESGFWDLSAWPFQDTMTGGRCITSMTFG